MSAAFGRSRIHKTGSVSYEIVWALRQQTDGWRIAGMATQVTPAEAPIFLNFEDPDEMLASGKKRKPASRPNRTRPCGRPDVLQMRLRRPGRPVKSLLVEKPHSISPFTTAIDWMAVFISKNWPFLPAASSPHTGYSRA